jgi:hypothetical protein
MKLLKFKKGAAALLMTLLLLIGIMPLGALAANTSSVTIEVAMDLSESSSTPTSIANFKFNLEALSDGAPLPDNTTATISFNATLGENVADFDPIVFTKVGRYEYKVTMDEDGVPSNFTHDSTAYLITVRADKDTKGNFYTVYMVTKEAPASATTGDETGSNTNDKTKVVVKSDEILFMTTYSRSSTPVTPVNPDPTPDPDPTPTPNPDPTPTPNPDPTPTPDPDPEPNPDPDPEPTPDPDPDPEPNPEPNPDPEPTPDPDPEPNPNPDNPTTPTNPDNPTTPTDTTTPTNPGTTTGTPGTTTTTTTTTTSTSPKTGDDTNTIAWVIMLVAVIVGLVCCVLYIKTNNRSRGKR